MNFHYDNVANDATCDTSEVNLSLDSRWWTGPPLLRLVEEEWPKEESGPWKDREANQEFIECFELKQQETFVLFASLDGAIPEIGCFLSWMQLLRATAWMLHYITNCITKHHSIYSELTIQEIHKAELLWIKYVQRQCFPGELVNLHSGEPVSRQSCLAQLSPELDKDGVIHLKGCLSAMLELDEDIKCPPIMDPNHLYVRLMINHYYVKVNHQGQEYVANQIRQSFWVL